MTYNIIDDLNGLKKNREKNYSLKLLELWCIKTLEKFGLDSIQTKIEDRNQDFSVLEISFYFQGTKYQGWTRGSCFSQVIFHRHGSQIFLDYNCSELANYLSILRLLE